uniref:G-protein coupled receptors family 1 profile domain-containing protein n=1 Tax=Parascaris univalens TaxID=6257 RepID=A0A915CF60_PARUN
GLNESAIEEQKVYYAKLLSTAVQAYTPVHVFVYQFLCITGVFANISIIVVLLRPAMRKNPFNAFLIAIAICDMTLMAFYFIYKQVEICHPTYFSYFWIVFTYVYAILSVFVHSVSLWFTVNMAILRYLVLKRSSISRSSLPNVNSFSAAFVAIILAILISFLGSAPNMLRYEIRDNGYLDVPSYCTANGSTYAHYYIENSKVHAYNIAQPLWWNCRWERFNFWAAGLVLKLIPCIMLTIFMTLLVRMLMEARERRTRLCGGTASGKSQAERTTSMLTAIVAVFLITELPQGLLVFATGIKPGVRYAMQYLGDFIDLLSLINSSFNFILCALMSHVFRREFLLTFGSCCPKSSEDVSGTKSAAIRAIPSKRNGFMPLRSSCQDGTNGNTFV